MSHLVQDSQFTQLGDYYKITVYSQVTPCEISVAGRLRSMHDEFSNFDHRVNVTTTGAQTAFRPASGAWWIMSLVASIVSGTVNPGDVLVKVELTQGVSPNNVPHQVLLFGSPDSFAPLTMGSPGEFSVDGRRARTVTLAASNPAVNLPKIWTVPSGVKWQVAAGFYALTTVPVTGSVKPFVYLSSPSGEFVFQADGLRDVGPGATGKVYLARGGSKYNSGVSGSEELPIPSVDLYPGGQVYFDFYASVGNIQVVSPRLTIEETILGY